MSRDDIEAFSSSFPDGNYKFIKGILQIHEVVVTPEDSTHILFKNMSHVCKNCSHDVWANHRIQRSFSNDKDEQADFQK